MNETTLFLVDYVIGEIPLRHWALTFPPPLRYLFAYDSELCTKALNIFVHTVFGWQRRVAKRELGLDSVEQAVPAAITAIHRVGSAINLNLHLHSAIADGVFAQRSAAERPEFRALPAPKKSDVVALAWEVCEKTTRMLQKAGKYFDADPSEADKLAQEYPLLAACCAASLQGSVVMGERAGQRVLRSGEYIEHGESGNIEQVQTLGHGFNLHAGMRVSASDKKGRERILRYILRPPIATKRLTLGKDGRVIYWLKEVWSDGSKCVMFEPLDFVAKLLPLIPPPRANLIRYHGAWAPHAAIREQIVPYPTDADEHGQLVLPLPRHKKPKKQGGAGAAGGGAGGDSRSGGERQSQDDACSQRLLWHDLASRTFGVDTLSCDRCGYTPMRAISVVFAPSSDQLAAVFNSTAGGAPAAWPRRSRAPPPTTGQMQFEFALKAA